MDQKEVIKYCKELGCCDACCLRLIGIKNLIAFDKPGIFLNKLLKSDVSENAIDSTTNNGSPPAKKQKTDDSNDFCVCCLGLLQDKTWQECFDMAKEILKNKKYACTSFACALSSPMSILLREKSIKLMLQEKFNNYNETLTYLKESWKWSFGCRLGEEINMTPDSGAVAPLLITFTIDYSDDLKDLEVLRTLAPSFFKKTITRRPIEQALSNIELSTLRKAGWECGVPTGTLKCTSVVFEHIPVYLGGRYIKLSRELPQTQWIVNGVRMMETSVQEIIFEPLGKLYGFSKEETEKRLKFMSAGREDVDVRCLGDGRPFAIEITDPTRELTEEELENACKEISAGGKVIVHRIIPITKEDLMELKKGEETKCKTYEALCIKLTHSKHDKVPSDSAVVITKADIDNINVFRNTDPQDTAKIAITQKTPIRVLHRRPLLTRSRKILDLEAYDVPDHPNLFVVKVRTEAGTYIKEWVHGELGRTQPSLCDAMSAKVDILALDVASVELDWPRQTKNGR